MQVGSISGSGFQSEPAPPSPAVPEPDAPVVLPQDEVVLTSTSPPPKLPQGWRPLPMVRWGSPPRLGKPRRTQATAPGNGRARR
jgi:hypothetical protein